MILEPMLDRLVAAAVVQRGRSGFIDFMPDTCDEGILLNTNIVHLTPIDWELPGYRKGQFQLVARGNNHQAAKTLVQAAADALTILGPTILQSAQGAIQVNHARPRHEPIVYPRSLGNKVEMSINFDCNYVIL